MVWVNNSEIIFCVFQVEQINIHVEYNGKPGFSLLEKEVTNMEMGRRECILWFEIKIRDISINLWFLFNKIVFKAYNMIIWYTYTQ